MPHPYRRAKMWDRATVWLAVEIIMLLAGAVVVALLASRLVVPRAPVLETPIMIGAVAVACGLIVWRGKSFQTTSATLAPWVCNECGYDMRALTGGSTHEVVCPECGTPWQP